MLLARSLGASYGRGKPMLLIDDEAEDKPKKGQYPIYLSKKEKDYMKSLSKPKSKKAIESMKRIGPPAPAR